MKTLQILGKTSLVLLAIFAFIPLTLATSIFKDVNDFDSSNVNFDAIAYLKNQNMIDGYPDGTFKPNNLINRAEFTKILVHAGYGYNPNSGDTKADFSLSGLSFKDLQANSWYIPYLRFAVQHKIIQGYLDKTFKPNNNINFSEASKIIVVALGYAPRPADAGPWYEPYVLVLSEKNAIPTTIKSFSQTLTRGEMAEIIYRLKSNITGKTSKTYDSLSGNEIITKGCVEDGGTYNATTNPSTTCCSNLVRYFPTYSKGQVLSGAGGVCLNPTLGLQEAINIYNTQNECTTNPELGQSTAELPFKNLNFNGYSFPMKSFRAGCGARCDVNLDKKTASIGWMCTGLLK